MIMVYFQLIDATVLYLYSTKRKERKVVNAVVGRVRGGRG
jgi:hypothetical protein